MTGRAAFFIYKPTYCFRPSAMMLHDAPTCIGIGTFLLLAKKGPTKKNATTEQTTRNNTGYITKDANTTAWDLPKTATTTSATTEQTTRNDSKHSMRDSNTTV